MRYTERYHRQSIPEWKDCYLSYPHMKEMIKMVGQCVGERKQINNKLAKMEREMEERKGSHGSMDLQIARGYYDKFVEGGYWANVMFQNTLNKELELFFTFVQFKEDQIQARFQKCKAFSQKIVKKQQKYNQLILLPFMEYLFVQAFSLKLMVESNIEAERRLLQKHKTVSQGIYPTPTAKIQAVHEASKYGLICTELQNFYTMELSDRHYKEDRYRLKKLAEVKVDQPGWLFWVGILVGVFISGAVYLGIFLDVTDRKLQFNSTFTRDFPLWRGIAFIIFYIWMLGINFFVYEHHNISHRFIFENNYTQYPKSSQVFGFASIFSILFIVFFSLYALNITQFISLGSMPAQYFPLFVWVPFILIMLNPISLFFYRARGYTFRLALKVLFSLFIPITFPIIWATDQLVSLFVIFDDLTYTVCYYSRFQIPTQDKVDIQFCRNTAQKAAFIFSIIVYSYRIIQCLRVGFCNGVYWKKSQFYNCMKYGLSLITAVLSYQWRMDNDTSIFPAWFVFAIITTIVSFGWDCVNDWDLFNCGVRNWMLRNRIVYGRLVYYVCVGVNFLLRCTWVLYISPSVVNTKLGSPVIFVLVFGMLQIARRGIWNIFRVQVQHIRNIENLRALPKQYQRLQQKMDQVLSSNEVAAPSGSVHRLLETGAQAMRWSWTYSEKVNGKEEVMKGIVAGYDEVEWQEKKMLKGKKKEIREMKEYLVKHLY